MNKECKHPTCSNPAPGKENFCYLHNSDNSVATERQFFELFIDYVVDKVFSDENQTKQLSKVSLSNAIKARSINNQTKSFLKKKSLHVRNIIFSHDRKGQTYDYTYILNLFGDLHFDKCHFHGSELDLKNAGLLFQECEFNSPWLIKNHRILPNEASTLYVGCQFKKDVHCEGLKKEKLVIENSLFSDCQFDNKLIFQCTHLESKPFCNSPNSPIEIEKLVFLESEFDDRVILNNAAIGNIELERSLFNKKVSLKNCVIQKASIKDCNFHGIFDCFKSDFYEFQMGQCIFDDFAGFENCRFYSAKDSNLKPALFVHSTFNSILNMREAKFNSGLDISSINSKDLPNFYGVEINSKNTNRETFRLVKHSFDTRGNLIEANRFFAEEMKKYGEEVKEKGKWQDRLVFFLNQKVSNFGQNYVWPLGWLLLFILFYSLIIHGYHKNWLYGISPHWDFFWQNLSAFLNGLAKNLLPFQRFLKQGLEFISLIFYVIFVILIWQIIVAVKRKVRR
jgi:hypothetical protein